MGMPKPTLWKDEYTLLCEDCGYIIEDLDESLPCPECGKPITESIPHYNAGSPWQQRRTLTNLIKTWFLTIFRSMYLCRQLNIDSETATSLLWVGLFTGFSVPVIGVIIAIVFLAIQEGFYPDSLTSIPIAIIIECVFVLMAAIYAALGAQRLRYYAYRRGYRIPPNSRWTIVGHASLGLTIAPIGITVAFITAGIMAESNFNDYAMMVQIILVTTAIIGWLSIPIALLEFEVLLHMGASAMRYRNQFPITNMNSLPLRPPQRPDSGYRTDIT